MSEYMEYELECPQLNQKISIIGIKEYHVSCIVKREKIMPILTLSKVVLNEALNNNEK